MNLNLIRPSIRAISNFAKRSGDSPYLAEIHRLLGDLDRMVRKHHAATKETRQ